jgi:hypothetical protein
MRGSLATGHLVSLFYRYNVPSVTLTSYSFQGAVLRIGSSFPHTILRIGGSFAPAVHSLRRFFAQEVPRFFRHLNSYVDSVAPVMISSDLHQGGPILLSLFLSLH